MNYDWSKVPFDVNELHGKTVHFKVPLEQGGFDEGDGKFDVQQHGSNVFISIYHPMVERDHVSVRRIDLPAECFPRLENREINGRKEFRLFIL